MKKVTYEQAVTEPLGERKGDISHRIDGDSEFVIFISIWATGEIPVLDKRQLGELHDSAHEQGTKHEDQEDEDEVNDRCTVVGTFRLLPKQGGTLDEEDEESAIRHV